MPSREAEIAQAYSEIFDALYDVVPPEEAIAPDEAGQIKCYETLALLQQRGFSSTEAMNLVLGTMLDIRPIKRTMDRVDYVEDVIHG